ncbi:MAG: cob(I)yrinic acid a,c-diamide adenosyltransferase [Deltaproteobacteria bacterium]|jgi:cob(I)alamin adenosyltransferase|nr:cob(I)yrinic acid a,c-diamide adenosyltransferase [Deltaproteobacteria bacterium]
MLLLYTGQGKGKTSACVGQAARAHGRGLRVAFGQFMKRPDQAGEQKVLSLLLGERFFASGLGFFRREEDRPAHREAAEILLAWAMVQARSVDMLILDEALYALNHGLLIREELEDLLDLSVRRPFHSGRVPFHLVLSGRGLPDWLRETADLVTEMAEIRHPHRKGGRPVPGIDF